MEHKRFRIAPLPETPEYNFEPIKSLGAKIGSIITRPIVGIREIAHELNVGLGNPVMKPEDLNHKPEETR